MNVGFTKIIHAIVQHRKPIVGHNFFLDILHIVHQFISRLPIIYEDFQEIVKSLFPFIFDTKHISIFLENLNKKKGKKISIKLYLNYSNSFFR